MLVPESVININNSFIEINVPAPYIHKANLYNFTGRCIATKMEATAMDDDAPGKNVDFVTLSAEKIPFGRNNFIEVARKKAITQEGENEFISLSRGYYLPDGTERFKKSVTIPDDPKIKDFVIEKIRTL